MSTPLNNSVVKAFQLLAIFKDSPNGLSLANVADRAGMVVPTTHRFLQTLLSIGALDKNDEGRYVIGSELRSIAEVGGAIDMAGALLDHHVRQLSGALHETVHVAVLESDMVHYIAKGETQRSLKIVTQVGTALEAYCTGVGKVLLAYSTPEYVQRYLNKGDLVALTPRTITDQNKFMSELQAIRDRSYAIDDEEFETGLRCIATPVAIGGRIVAALSCSAPSSRMTDEALPIAIAATTRRAQLISADFDRRGLLDIT